MYFKSYSCSLDNYYECIW